MRRKGRETMKEIYKGLCETCVHAKECSYTRDPSRPVLLCEEFEGERKKQEEKSRKSKPRKQEGENRGAGPNYDPSLKGLCGTCERRDSCTYPRPEWGVWHCDEYE